MSRYIDADAFDIVGYIVPHGMDFNSFEAGVNHVMNIIHNTPTADVVEVVRCKDCRYWQEYQEGHYPNELCPWDKNETTDEDDYCSYGERREDEQ